MQQNIYDNQEFFDGYRKLRENKDNANLLIEKPYIFSLLPSLKGKSILDMGCGYGENCKEFVQLGATFILGIDVSNKMLEVATCENSDNKITYLNLCMEDISRINNKFDVIISSLAVHYINDFNKLAYDVFSLLNDDGVFIFSQEHPLTTAPINGATWIRDNNGAINHYCLTDYSITGKRTVSWIVDGIIKYHRTFSDIFLNLTDNGFCIDRLMEPLPSKEIIKKIPEYKNNFHKPNFLIIRAIKKHT